MGTKLEQNERSCYCSNILDLIVLCTDHRNSLIHSKYISLTEPINCKVIAQGGAYIIAEVKEEEWKQIGLQLYNLFTFQKNNPPPRGTERVKLYLKAPFVTS